MKKLIIIILLMILSTSAVFAESVDDEYINLIFDKFASYDEETRAKRAGELKFLFSDDRGLDVLYIQVVDNKQDAMKAYGISEAELRKNIDALKTWSKEDRRAMVDAGASGDKSAVYDLNDKYEKSVVTLPSTSLPPVTTLPPATIELTRLESLAEKGLIVNEILEVEALKEKRFKDTETHWSNDYVLFLVSRDIISGRSEDSFAPEANISKAEIVTLITKLIIDDVDKLPKYEASISDIEQGNWYDAHMKRGVVLGLIQEDESGTIQPDHKSSREEVVSMLIKAIETLEIPVTEEMKVYKGDFKDFDLVEDSRKEAMTIAINLGLITGNDDKTLKPSDEIKRSEIAVVIKKMYLYILENML